jgi:hypothetical protein
VVPLRLRLVQRRQNVELLARHDRRLCTVCVCALRGYLALSATQLYRGRLRE